MQDRIPMKPNRYAVYDDAHNFVRHEYHERADEPTQTGDALNKANLLPDDVAGLLSLTGNPQVKDALSSLALGPGRYGYSLAFTYSNGVPVQNKLVSGIVSLLNAPVYTDADGKAFGVSESLSPTISIDFPDYLDVSSFSQQIEGAFPVTSHSLTIPLKSTTSVTLTSSRAIKFSEAVATFMGGMFGGGGGGGGGSEYHRNNDSYYGGGGGAGGFYTNIASRTPSYNTSYTAAVGARGSGGTGGTYVYNNAQSQVTTDIAPTPGGTGGTTSISGIGSAAGGGGGGSTTNNSNVTIGGTGNGNGGTGNQTVNGWYGTNGSAGTNGVGGGGGGGGTSYSAYGSGANGGGSGGLSTGDWMNPYIAPTAGNYGCGGGGGHFSGDPTKNGAAGGSGKIMLEWVLK